MLYGRYAGTKVKIGEDEHILLNESDILGVKGGSLAELKPTEVRRRDQLSCRRRVD